MVGVVDGVVEGRVVGLVGLSVEAGTGAGGELASIGFMLTKNASS